MLRIARAIAGTAALLVVAPVTQAETLLEVYRLVQQSNPERMAQIARRDANHTIGKKARAVLLPSLSLSYALQHQDETISNSSNPFSPNFSASYGSQSGRLSLNQPLFNAEAIAALKVARAGMALADIELLRFEQDLIIRTADAYFQLATAAADVQFTIAEKIALTKRLDAASEEYKIGEGDRVTLDEVRARRDLSATDVLIAQQRERLAQELLRELTGKGAIQAQPKVQTLPAQPFGSLEQALTTANASNPEWLIARKQSEQSRGELSRIRSKRLPTVSLFGQRNYSDSSESPLGREAESTVYGVQLEAPLFTGGLRSAEVEEAKLLDEAANQQMLAVQRSVERQVRSAWLNMLSAKAQTQSLELALTSAESALAASEAGYAVGLRSNLDVLDTRSSVLRAKRDLTRARLNYLLAQLQVLRAAGGLDLAAIAAVSALLDG